MNQQDYDALAKQGYSHIPVVHEILADLETPLSAYLKLADGPYSYLLESAAQGGEKWGRYSIIGLPSDTVIRVHGDRLTVEEDGKIVEELDTDDPLAAIESFSRRFNIPDLPDMPRFFGGLVGYFGYDTVRSVEKRLKGTAPPDDLGTPDILLMVSTDVLVFDNMSSRMKLISLTDPATPNAFALARETAPGPGRQARRGDPRSSGRPPPMRRWRKRTSNRPSGAPTSWPPWNASGSTTALATPCRWCSRNACPSRF